MTVKDLKALLETIPEDYTVVVPLAYSWYYHEVTKSKTDEMVDCRHHQYNDALEPFSNIYAEDERNLYDETSKTKALILE